MRLTSFIDFGLRVLMRMAGDPERSFTTADLTEEFRISRNHLAKVVSALGDAGYLETRRGGGGGGGARLARPIEDIRLGDVVACLEADQALVECFAGSGNSCTLTLRCRLKARLGGWKMSGLGRALSRIGLDAFRQSKMGVIDWSPTVQEWWYLDSDSWFSGTEGSRV